ncbi:MAG: putative porin [Bacteroidia bacterium]|nr:putative porin [Bacteroidia bacterium]
MNVKTILMLIQGLALMLLLFAGQQAHAQFPTTRPGSPTGPPSDAGDLYGSPSDFSLDSLGTDSANLSFNIKPNIKAIDKEALFAHRHELTPVGNTLERSIYFDPIENIPGFVRSLGQIGKPYQAYLFGLEESFYDLGLWRDPVFNRYDRYLLDADNQVRYFDTKTPYIDIIFTQGQRKLQVVDVTLSRSFGPSLNVAGYLRRPQSEGAYRNFVTDHTQAFLSSHYQTRKSKYHAFTNITFNRHNDQLNGGVSRAQNPDLYPVADGLIQENIATYNQTFFKENTSPYTDAQLFRKTTTAYLDQYYHLIGESDSTEKKHKISLRNRIQYDWQSRRFFDSGIDTTRRKTNLVPQFPTLADRTNAIEDSFSVRRLDVMGAISYSWLLASGWQANASAGLNYQRIAVSREDFSLNQNITEQFGGIRLSFPGGYLAGDIRQRVSDQFSTEQKLNAELAIAPFARKDSLANAGELSGPIAFTAHAMAGNLNPSLFQARMMGGTGNAYLPNDSLGNEQVLHLRAALSWRPEVVIRGADTLLPNMASVGAFWSNRQNPILYTSDFQVTQGAEAITRLGLDANVRLRFLRHFHFENNLQYMPRLTSSTDETIDLYLRSVPELRGRSSIYFDHRDLKIAREFRLGLGMNWWTGYAGQTLEPISGEFFPTNYNVLPFATGDAFFQLNIHGVFLYFRYFYLNENLLYNGYYSTPFYPMMERSYVLGINWTFYD